MLRTSSRLNLVPSNQGRRQSPSAPAMFGEKSPQARRGRRARILATTVARQRAASMRRRAVKALPILSALRGPPVGRTAAARRIADPARPGRVLEIAAHAHRAIAARVRQAKASPGIAPGRPRVRPFDIPRCRRDRAARVPAVRRLGGASPARLLLKSRRQRVALRHAPMIVVRRPSLWMMKRAHAAAAPERRRPTQPRPCHAPRASRSGAKAD